MLGINAQTGQALAGLDHLRQSIADILTTRIGTCVMRRDLTIIILDVTPATHSL